jgi:hypothetical protein
VSNVLMSCPFCGGEAETDQTAERFEYCIGGPYSVMDFGYVVYCTKCDASMFDRNVPPATEEEAVAAWNRRAVPPMPSDHEATIKQALHWMRDDGRQIRLSYGRDFHDDAMARIDATLAWLNFPP